jgi:hypothetical protein
MDKRKKERLKEMSWYKTTGNPVGRPPMSAEDRKKAHDRRKAKDRERRGLIGEIRTPQTPEQKRAKEAEKKRLQYFRKKSLT